MSGREVVAVCIEVASPEIMAGWLDAGLMPNLAALRDQGSWADLASPSELSSGSLWPTFTTGVGPGRHGHFFTHMQLECQSAFNRDPGSASNRDPPAAVLGTAGAEADAAKLFSVSAAAPASFPARRRPDRMLLPVLRREP